MAKKISTTTAIEHEAVRTGSNVESLKQVFSDNFFYVQGKFRDVATPHDIYMAAAYSVRDRVMERWIAL